MPRLEVAPALTIELLLLEILEGWTRSYPQYRIAAEIASSPKQAVALAGSVARFLDELEIEGIDPRELSNLFGGDAAHHHDAAVGFLDHVRKELPAALHSRGLVSETAARSARLRRRAAELETRTDAGPIIIAGSTGTVPATRALMKSALASEQGWVVLPGLDLELDEASWAAVGPQHPQFAMRQLLAELARDRSLVEEVASAPEASRRWLLREMMRPPETLFHWSASPGQNGRGRAALADLELIEAADPKEEADVVALILRSVVETPGRSVAVVTPDRSLARRIRIAGARHGLDFDDSAGESLLGLPAGALAGLVVEFAVDGFTLGSFLALIHHNHCQAGFSRAEAMALAGRVARLLAEDMVPAGSLDEVVRPVAAACLRDGADRQAFDACLFLERVVAALAPVLDPTPRPAAAQLAGIVAACEMLAGSALYAGDDGESLGRLFARLEECLDSSLAANPALAAAFLSRQIAETRLRPRAAKAGSIPLLGLLEARMMDFDVVVLAGLTEGSWPRHVDQGPWISRSMRRALGLKMPEADIGQTAHDFVQAIGARTAYLTWSRKEAGTPVLATRWIGRLMTFLQAQGEARPEPEKSAWLGLARGLGFHGAPRPFARPAPRPPASLQPLELSVTQIETLIRDPYQIYARKVLRLKPRPVSRYRPDYSLKGQIFHDIINDFLDERRAGRAPDPHEALLRLGRKRFGRLSTMPEIAAFWWAPFEAAAHWLAGREEDDAGVLLGTFSEVTGTLVLPLGADAFTLTCRADRIDLLRAGGARIIDYKTGLVPSGKQVALGLAPQLTLEAAILDRGGFQEIGAVEPRELHYIKIGIREDGGESAAVAKDERPRELGNLHLGYLLAYLADLRSSAEPWAPRRMIEKENEEKPRDYDHLSRHGEWSLDPETAA